MDKKLASIVALVLCAALFVAMSFFWNRTDSRELMGTKPTNVPTSTVRDSQGKGSDKSSSPSIDKPRVPSTKVVGLYGLTLPTEIAVHGRATRPDGRLADRYAELSSRASSGDANAAMQLGLGLAICASAPKDQAELYEWTLGVQTTESHPNSGFRTRDPDNLIESFKADFLFCEGLRSDRISEFAHWIVQAADNGHLEALTELTNSVGVDIALRQEAHASLWPSPEAETEFRVSTLKQAVSRGSVTAMTLLSQYANRGLVPDMTETEIDALFVASVAASEAAGKDVSLLRIRADEILDFASHLERDEILRRSQELLDEDHCCVILENRKNKDST